MLRTAIGPNAVGGVASAILLWSTTGAAQAQDFSVKLEPGVTIPLSAPQADVYDTGGSQSLRALFGTPPTLDRGPPASFPILPAEAEGGESGVIWGLGAGLRWKGARDPGSSRFS